MPGDILGCHTWPLGHWPGVGGARDALKPCTMCMRALPLPHNEGVPPRWYVDPQDGRETPQMSGSHPKMSGGPRLRKPAALDGSSDLLTSVVDALHERLLNVVG